MIPLFANKIVVLIFVTEKVPYLVLCPLPFAEDIGKRFRQPHLADTGIGFRLFQNDTGACVWQERREDR